MIMYNTNGIVPGNYRVLPQSRSYVIHKIMAAKKCCLYRGRRFESVFQPGGMTKVRIRVYKYVSGRLPSQKPLPKYSIRVQEYAALCRAHSLRCST